MKQNQNRRILQLLLVFIGTTLQAQEMSDPSGCSHSRLMESGISESILGGLRYLKEKQVTCQRYTVAPEDFRPAETTGWPVFRRIRSGLANRLAIDTHVFGAWPSFVSFNPTKIPPALRPLFTVTDYNLFTTASTAFCLYYFDESHLPDTMRFISPMQERALKAIESFKRGHSYNFWQTRTHPKVPYSYVSPPNIPKAMISIRKLIYDVSGLMGPGTISEGHFLVDWIDRIYNRKENRTGKIALFNIPNDSDDTSMALIIKFLHDRKNGMGMTVADSLAMGAIVSFRDNNREKADRHNAALGPETGAYLTWHKAEAENVFTQPELGIIPLDANNVDITVNANVLYALYLGGLTRLPGHDATVRLFSRIILEGSWRHNSLYYLDKLWFPYCLSRAIRGGFSPGDELTHAVPVLLADIIREQQAFERAHPDLEGAFPVFDSVSYVMTTALGLNCLLNLGRSVAIGSGLENEYDHLIKKSVRFLLAHRNPITDSTLHTDATPMYWQSGPLYSSSVKSLAHWFSHVQCTGLVVEALAKYAMCFDTQPSSKSHQLKLFCEETPESVKPAIFLSVDGLEP